MPFRRRRATPSDWVLALKASRAARILRRNLPSSTNCIDISADLNDDLNDDPIIPTTLQVPVSMISRDHVHFNTERVPNEIVVDGGCHEEAVEIPAPDIDGYEKEAPRQTLATDASSQSSVPSEIGDGFVADDDDQPQPHNLSADIVKNVENPNQEGIEANAGAESWTGYQDQMQEWDIVQTKHLTANNVNQLPNIEVIIKRREKWGGRLNLTALIAVVGSVRFTVQQYEYTRDIIDGIISMTGDKWLPYSRTQLFFRDIVNHCFPTSHLVRFPKFGSQNTSDQEELGPVLHPPNSETPPTAENAEFEWVRIFLPSAWARLDISTSVVYNDMYPSAADSELNSLVGYPIV